MMGCDSVQRKASTAFQCRVHGSYRHLGVRRLSVLICRILAFGQGCVANYLHANWAFPRRHRTDADE
jgi:hypothetical protein